MLVSRGGIGKHIGIHLLQTQGVAAWAWRVRKGSGGGEVTGKHGRTVQRGVRRCTTVWLRMRRVIFNFHSICLTVYFLVRTFSLRNFDSLG